MTHVLLLDIDGVLIRPGGYRAAVRATLNHVLERMGLPPQPWDETLLGGLEARGITSEWDMTALLLAALLDALLEADPALQGIPHTLEAALPWVRARLEGRGYLKPKLQNVLRQVRARLEGRGPQARPLPAFTWQPGEYPATAALRLGLFPHLPAGLRADLLAHTRDVSRSLLTRLFQTFTLGSAAFRETYGQEAPLESESLLRRHDHPLIPPGVRAALRSAWQRNEIRLCAFTARPSRPPRGVVAAPASYAPEAELALESVGMADLALISWGKLRYAAEPLGLDPEALLKPSPVHALAALGAALHDDEHTALTEAIHWAQHGALRGHLAALPAPLHLHVVEDTLGGVRAVRAAVEALQQAGLEAHAHPWGLNPPGSLKAEAMQREGVPCFANWEALGARLLPALGV